MVLCISKIGMNTSKHHLNEADGEGSPRLILGCVLGSVLLHLLLLNVLPSWRIEQVTPPAVLDVQLLAPAAETAAAPQAAVPVRTQPQPAPVPPVRTPAATPAVIAVEAAAPASEAPRFTVAPATVAAPAPVAPPATAAAPAASASRSETVTPPSFSAAYLRNPPPEYPPLAKRRGEEGMVMLKVLVTADGAPARIEIESSSGSRLLDAAATEAVRGWRFQPARRGNQNIEDWARVPLRFRLDS